MHTYPINEAHGVASILRDEGPPASSESSEHGAGDVFPRTLSTLKRAQCRKQLGASSDHQILYFFSSITARKSCSQTKENETFLSLPGS